MRERKKKTIRKAQGRNEYGYPGQARIIETTAFFLLVLGLTRYFSKRGRIIKMYGNYYVHAMGKKLNFSKTVPNLP